MAQNGFSRYFIGQTRLSILWCKRRVIENGNYSFSLQFFLFHGIMKLVGGAWGWHSFRWSWQFMEENSFLSCAPCQGDLSAEQVSVVWNWALSVDLSTEVFALPNSYHSPCLSISTILHLKNCAMCNTSKRSYQKSFVARIVKS